MIDQDWEGAENILPGNEDAEAWVIAPEDGNAEERETRRRRRRLLAVAVVAAWAVVLVVGSLNTTIGQNGYPQIDTPGFLQERAVLVSMAQAVSANDSDAAGMVDVEQAVDNGRMDSYTATTKLESIGNDLVTRGEALTATSAPASLEAIYQLVATANQDLISCVSEYESYLVSHSADDAAKTQGLWSQYNKDQGLAIQELRQAGRDLNVPMSLSGGSKVNS